VLAAYGIPVTFDRLCTTATEAAAAAAEIGFPVVMKIASAGIDHKSDLGLVQLGVSSAAHARRSFARLTATAADAARGAAVDGVLVCETAPPGVECVVGVVADDLFGPTVMFGLGGVFVEVFEDVAFRVPPFDKAEARRMVAQTRGAKLLAGARGRPPADVGALVDVLMKVQRLAVDHAGTVAELDINPLLVTPSGAVALDALIVTAP
jgi:acyl-CoA synthetase (NDP forming)